MKETRKITIVETECENVINTELTVCNAGHGEALYTLMGAVNKIISKLPEDIQDEAVEICVASLLFD